MRLRLSYYIAQKVSLVKTSCRSFCSNVDKHVYDNVIPFETNKQLANYVCENILYDKNGIIVVNKPYGVCFSRDRPQWKGAVPMKQGIQHKLLDKPDYNHNYISTELDEVNLYEALPYIRSNLDCHSLCVIKSPEKYTTGVCILGRSENIRKKITICWERSRAQKVPIESYIAVCSGVPIKSYVDNLKIGITLDVAENAKSKKAILTNTYSKNSVLKSIVKVATVNSSTLSVNADKSASLVEIICNQKKWHFVRLFLASHLLSPALGDHLFGSRVKKIMGSYLKIHHWNTHASLPQKLPSELLNLLDLRPGSEKYIPTMIHVSEVNLLGFPRRSDNIIVSAPVPPHFNWTVDKLGLQMPSKTLALKKIIPPAEQLSVVI